MTLVVDASIAMRWLVQGGDNASVDALFDDAVGNGGESLLIAPALIMLEVHNSLAKLWNRGLVTFPQFAEGPIRLSAALQIESVDRGLTVAASSMSMQAEVAKGRPVTARTVPFNICDCVYIALAQHWAAPLVTADRAQAEAAAAFGCRCRFIG